MTGTAGLVVLSGVRGTTTVRLVLRAVPPVGANVVATVKRRAPALSAVRLLAPSRQVRVYVPARFAAFVVEQSVAFLRATPETDCLRLPSPGTVSVVETVIVEFVVENVEVSAVKAFEGRENVAVAAGASENVAVTARASDIASVHVPIPEQAPVHPANVDPLVGVAASVTDW